MCVLTDLPILYEEPPAQSHESRMFIQETATCGASARSVGVPDTGNASWTGKPRIESAAEACKIIRIKHIWQLKWFGRRTKPLTCIEQQIDGVQRPVAGGKVDTPQEKTEHWTDR